MKNVFLSLIFLLPFASSARQCDCATNFEYVVKSVKANYAGFNDKINNQNRKAFNVFTDSLRRKAALANNVDSCYVLLRKWTNYFKDAHLRVQLDWRYREKHPEAVKAMNKLFAKPVNVKASAEVLDTRTGIRKLDDNTLLITLPSFEWSEKKEIDSLLTSYSADLDRFPNWIIDLRGNTGGTDYAFSALIPYLYTTPIKIKPDEFLSSPENIKILTENLSDNSLSQGGKDFISQLIDLMKKHPGQFVNPSGQDNFEVKMDTVRQFPRKVAVLIDRNTASSAESFLLTAMQSKKVKVYGEHSYGMLDYNNTQYFDIPCKDLNLVIAIGRSKRLPEYPIDNIGIKPDVEIGNTEINKIEYVRNKMDKP